ncbi:MAG: hypothetical protein WA705_11575 [Candidatus Ozemobacteraceae bacterium]
MKLDNIRFLLTTKIPSDPLSWPEILRALQEAFAESRHDDVFTILRASYMGAKDIDKRREYYLSLAKVIGKSLPKAPRTASGQSGLYIDFIAEDLMECPDSELSAAGSMLKTILRTAGNPVPVLAEGVEPIQMGALPFRPEEAAQNPERLVEALLQKERLFDSVSAQDLRLKLSRNTVEIGSRERATALVVMGGFLEKTPAQEWVQACYYAAGAVDPTFDIPWAFLSQHSSDLQQGLRFSQQALRANPRSLAGFSNRGAIWARLGKFSCALRDFAEVLRFQPDDPRILLLAAHAAKDCGNPLCAAEIFLSISRLYPSLSEPWCGLANLMMVAGFPETARVYQEQCRHLHHGNVPRELRLCGHLRISGPIPGIAVKLDGKDMGGTPVDLDEITPGEHRVEWNGGPIKKVMVDEGDTTHLIWSGTGDDVRIAGFKPEPKQYADSREKESRPRSARLLLAAFCVKNLDDLPVSRPMSEILRHILPPVSPFEGEGRLTLEVVFAILLEEILADGVLDKAENEILRAVRDRLMIEGTLYAHLLDGARKRAACRETPAGPLDPVSLYRRLYAKALEDGCIEPAERELLEAIAEALLLTPVEIAEIERSAKHS